MIITSATADAPWLPSMARDGKREIRKCRLITGSYDQRLLKVRQASIGTDRADLRAGRGSAKFAGRESEAGKPVKAQRRFKDFDDIWDTMRVIAASLPTQEGRVGDSAKLSRRSGRSRGSREIGRASCRERV